MIGPVELFVILSPFLAIAFVLFLVIRAGRRRGR